MARNAVRLTAVAILLLCTSSAFAGTIGLDDLNGEAKLGLGASPGYAGISGEYGVTEDGNLTRYPGLDLRTSADRSSVRGRVTRPGDGVWISIRSELDPLDGLQDGLRTDINVDLLVENPSTEDREFMFRYDLWKHSAHADGPDAWVGSWLHLDGHLHGLVSDTILGDERNRSPLGSYGATLRDCATWIRSVTVTAGAERHLRIDWTQECAVLGADSSTLGYLDLEVTLHSVRSLAAGFGADAPSSPAELAVLGVLAAILLLARIRPTLQDRRREALAIEATTIGNGPPQD